jgi:hypothetical protein
MLFETIICRGTTDKDAEDAAASSFESRDDVAIPG